MSNLPEMWAQQVERTAAEMLKVSRRPVGDSDARKRRELRAEIRAISAIAMDQIRSWTTTELRRWR